MTSSKGGRPPKSVQNLKSHSVTISLTPSQMEELQKKSLQSGLKPSLLAAQFVNQAKVYERIPSSTLKNLAGLYNNLNQISKALNYFKANTGIGGLEKKIEDCGRAMESLDEILK